MTTDGQHAPGVPIACALDAAQQHARTTEFGALFRDSVVGKDRTQAGIRFRFAAGPGIEDRVRDLARREQQCCPFFEFTITRAGGEVLWDAGVANSDGAAILDELYALPDTIAAGGAPLLFASIGHNEVAASPAGGTSGARVLLGALIACGLACSAPPLIALAGSTTLGALSAPRWVIVAAPLALVAAAIALRRTRRSRPAAGAGAPGSSCGC